jgi:hypothetical protein
MTMQETENTAALLGRVAMSVIFIHGGWGKLLAPVATQAMLAGDGAARLVTCRRRRIGRRAGDPDRAVHPTGRAGAGDMVRRHRPDCAIRISPTAIRKSIS